MIYHSKLLQNLMKYNKLVRDKIPEVIKAKGGSPVVRIASHEEYWLKLKEKLQEEVAEFIASESPEEIADIYEVIEAICEHKQFPTDHIKELKTKKADERGGFKDKIILEEA